MSEIQLKSLSETMKKTEEQINALSKGVKNSKVPVESFSEAPVNRSEASEVDLPVKAHTEKVLVSGDKNREGPYNKNGRIIPLEKAWVFVGPIKRMYGL